MAKDVVAVELIDEFYNKLTTDKIKINWNKNPIAMKKFLQFLTVSVEKSHDHLGCGNGWTQYKNDPLGLIVSGGICNGNEWLDSLQLKGNRSNKYNNYVNPFFLWGILTDDGKSFFVNYYESEIISILDNSMEKIKIMESNLRKALQLQEKIIEHVKLLKTFRRKNEVINDL